jgi:hypothetical protein
VAVGDARIGSSPHRVAAFRLEAPAGSDSERGWTAGCAGCSAPASAGESGPRSRGSLEVAFDQTVEVLQPVADGSAIICHPSSLLHAIDDAPDCRAGNLAVDASPRDRPPTLPTPASDAVARSGQYGLERPPAHSPNRGRGNGATSAEGAPRSGRRRSIGCRRRGTRRGRPTFTSNRFDTLSDVAHPSHSDRRGSQAAVAGHSPGHLKFHVEPE